jgi:hypothetical protein
MKIVPRLQKTQIQKMIKKYRKFQYNLTMRGIVYTFLYKNKKNFFIFFKPWYNWYNLKKDSNTNSYSFIFVPKGVGTIRYNWYNC